MLGFLVFLIAFAGCGNDVSASDANDDGSDMGSDAVDAAEVLDDHASDLQEKERTCVAAGDSCAAGETCCDTLTCCPAPLGDFCSASACP